jgi:hypothetical protein
MQRWSAIHKGETGLTIINLKKWKDFFDQKLSYQKVDFDFLQSVFAFYCDAFKE